MSNGQIELVTVLAIALSFTVINSRSTSPLTLNSNCQRMHHSLDWVGYTSAEKNAWKKFLGWMVGEVTDAVAANEEYERRKRRRGMLRCFWCGIMCVIARLTNLEVVLEMPLSRWLRKRWIIVGATRGVQHGRATRRLA